jgi:ribonuclease HI
MQTTVDLAQVGSGNPKRPPNKKDRWKAPDEGVIKINTDASFLEATMSGGTGLVVHDHWGSLIRGQAIWYGDAASALIMEARAILDGARLAMERNYNRVIIESDS